eukprot:GHRQ01000800.1.p1 GENE.GHRQ01000800.1~~GHRQ01000800.1.p1  ORF type:complete len:361 (+),score=177.76 GHRQ01000800.1:181-1263(+)
MAPVTVTSILFKDFVNDGKVPEDNFVVNKEHSIDPETDVKDAQICIRLLYLSVDPYMRTRMRKMESYYLGSGFEPGKPLAGGCVAQVVCSKAAGFAEGEVLSGMLPWSSHQILDADAQKGLQKVEPSMLGEVPLSYFVGVLGMPGMTAWAGLKKIAEPIKEGEVALVSAAAGAVGLTVGQLLKHVYGCKVIGSAGSNDKVALLRDLGFDAAFNYHTTPKEQALKEAAPDGIDIYWENVGGPVLETVLELCRPHARIVACGMISQYDLPDEEKYGVKNLFNLIGKRIKMQGFVVGDYYSELGKEFVTTMGEYVQQGKVKAVEHVTQGIENAGRAWVEMMAGGNTGKAVVKVVAKDPFPVKK